MEGTGKTKYIKLLLKQSIFCWIPKAEPEKSLFIYFVFSGKALKNTKYLTYKVFVPHFIVVKV